MKIVGCIIILYLVYMQIVMLYITHGLSSKSDNFLRASKTLGAPSIVFCEVDTLVVANENASQQLCKATRRSGMRTRVKDPYSVFVKSYRQLSQKFRKWQILPENV
jgi:hypothetical protein